MLYFHASPSLGLASQLSWLWRGFNRMWQFDFQVAVSFVHGYRRVRRGGGGGGGALGARASPTWEKSSAQNCPKEERKFRPNMSAKKIVHVPFRYDRIKTKKVGKKKEKSKERYKIKEIKKEGSRLSEIEIIQ